MQIVQPFNYVVYLFNKTLAFQLVMKLAVKLAALNRT